MNDDICYLGLFKYVLIKYLSFYALIRNIIFIHLYTVYNKYYRGFLKHIIPLQVV